MKRSDFWAWLDTTTVNAKCKRRLSVQRGLTEPWDVIAWAMPVPLGKYDCPMDTVVSMHRTRRTADESLAKYRRWLKEWEKQNVD